LEPLAVKVHDLSIRQAVLGFNINYCAYRALLQKVLNM